MKSVQSRDHRKSKRNPHKILLVVELILALSGLLLSQILTGEVYRDIAILVAFCAMLDMLPRFKYSQEYEEYGRVLSNKERRNPPARLDDSDHRRKR